MPDTGFVLTIPNFSAFLIHDSTVDSRYQVKRKPRGRAKFQGSSVQ